MTAPAETEETQPRPAPAYRALKLAMLVFLFSLIIRVAWVSFAHVTPISDFLGYDNLATNWLRTGHFAQSGSYAYRTPGYPGFLAIVYAIAGHGWRTAGLVQAVLGALTSGLLVLLAAHILSPRASLIAGLLHSLSPTAIAYVPVLASETLAAFLIVSGLLCLASAEAGEGRRRLNAIGGSGAIFGLIVLVRPAATFFLPAGFLLSAYSPKQRQWRLTGGLVFLVTTLLVLSPWLIRNQRLGLGFFTISSVGGENLWMGNNPKAKLGGFCAEAAWPVKAGEGERNRDGSYRNAARAWMLSHPGRYLTLTATRAHRLLGAEPDTWAAKYLWPIPDNDLLFVTTDRLGQRDAAHADVWNRASYVEGRHATFLRRLRLVIAPLIFISLLVALVWWRDYAVVLLPSLCYLGGLSLTYTEIRFRELSDPLLFVPLAGLLAMFIFRSTELVSEPLRPSEALAAALSILKTFTPDFQRAKELPPSPISAAAAQESLRIREQEAIAYRFARLDLATPEMLPAALWNYPTWSVSIARRQEGVRCVVQSSAHLSAEQQGGVVLPAGPFRALRLEMSFVNPRRITAVHVEACDSSGKPCVRWQWQVLADNVPPILRQTYVLAPGQPSWYFTPEGDSHAEQTAQLRIYLHLAPTAKAGFVLHRAEAAAL